MLRVPSDIGIGLACWLAAGAVAAQGVSASQGDGVAQQSAKQPRHLQARLSGSLLLSDDLGGIAGGRDAGAVLTISPGFRYAREGAEWQAALDYTLNAVTTFKTEIDPRRLQHALRANARGELRDTGLSLESQAQISQQTRSLFDRQSSGPRSTGQDRNQAEVYSLMVAPSWKVKLGPRLSLLARHAAVATNTRDSQAGDSLNSNSELSLGTEGGLLGWRLGAQRDQTRPRGARKGLTEGARATLFWNPDIDWAFSLNAGRERSNLRDPAGESGGTYGASLTWRPTPRTQLVARSDERVFGPTHAISFEHRFQRAAIRYSETKGVTAPGVTGAAGAQTNYELLFAQYASIEPNPTARDALVRAQLQLLGLSPDARAAAGFISGRSSLTHQRVLSASYTMPRITWTLAGTWSVSERLDGIQAIDDDFALSRELRTKGLALGMSYQLTPLSSLAASANWQRNGDESDQRNSRLLSASLTYSTRLAPDRQFSAALRHTQYDATLRPYEENSLLFTLSQQF